MTTRARIVVFAAVVVVAVVFAGVVLLRDSESYRERASTAPTASATPAAAVDRGPRILFRHTGLDSEYGLVATVALDDPSGPRAFSDVPCDRVAATDQITSCLVTLRGVVTKFKARLYSPDWELEDEVGLPGIPSRTRLSDDSSLVATTSFVTGHSYMTDGFSTATSVRQVDGTDYGNLEKFQLVVDGKPSSPKDRNVWGVTFVDDETFYATVETGETTYLVLGDLRERTLTAVTDDAECPSVSPDKTKVAFKIDLDPGDPKLWGLAVLDLATGKRTELVNAPRGVDDQVAWLDDDTLIYGLPRADEAGVDHVWALDITADAEPTVLIEQAWSPTVVR